MKTSTHLEPIVLIFGNNHSDDIHVRHLTNLMLQLRGEYTIIYGDESRSDSDISKAITSTLSVTKDTKECFEMLDISLNAPNKEVLFKKKLRGRKLPEDVKDTMEYRAWLYDTYRAETEMYLRMRANQIIFCSPKSNKDVLVSTTILEKPEQTLAHDEILTNDIIDSLLGALRKAQATAQKPVLCIVNTGIAHTQTLVNSLTQKGCNNVFGLNSLSDGYVEHKKQYEGLDSFSKRAAQDPTYKSAINAHNSLSEPISNTHMVEEACGLNYKDMVTWVKGKISQCYPEETVESKWCDYMMERQELTVSSECPEI